MQPTGNSVHARSPPAVHAGPLTSTQDSGGAARGADLCRVNTASQCLSVRPFTRCMSSMTRHRHRTRLKAVWPRKSCL